jgi:glycosyltransferase involved in cell wall biosynthesis
MNSENNTLVILTPGFPGSEADSTCLPMQQNFVRTWEELFPQMNIIVLSFQYPYFKKTYNWSRTTVISFNGQNKGGLARLLARRKLNAKLGEINNNHKITGILSFWYGECALVGKRFGSKHNIKHYCWILGQDARKGNRYPKRVRANESELIALSDFLLDEFEKNHYRRPMHLIPPGIDLKQYITPVKDKSIDILGAGSLIPLKRFDIFLEILAEIKKDLPAVKAILVGAGPEKEKLQFLILKYGLQNNITLAGELAHDEVLQLMQRTKIFLHPSSYEGFSGVCLEALSGGAHVISFCKAMNQEIEHWHIVESKKAMKQKTSTILQNTNTSYSSVSPFLMSDTVKAVAKLFN